MDTKNQAEPLATTTGKDQHVQNDGSDSNHIEKKTKKRDKNHSPDDDSIKWDAEIKKYATLALGFVAFVLWVILFISGINLDSKYYRAAITYNYAGWNDWLMTIISFTLSNVILLAFLSGFLGGACSKIIYTQGFTLSEKQLKKEGHNNVLFENPVISAFRGVFVFIALLAFQYLSSFSDMGAMDTVMKQQDLSNIYKAIDDSVTDTNSKQTITRILQQKQAQLGKDYNDSIVLNIRKFQDSLKIVKDTSSRNLLSEKIRQSRTKVALPELADIPGLSSSSYFRFAVIVSLFSFICGYDPTRFGSIINMFQILSAKNKDKDEENSKDTKKDNGNV